MGAARLAVVGTKGMGRGHIKAINAVPSCELAAICDTNPDEAKACAAEFGVPGYTELDRMLAEEKLDGLTICTPHWFHPSITMKACAAGLHVLTEKPMAVTVEDAERMIEAARKAGRVLAVVFQQRTRPVSRRAREIIESGAIGEIRRTLLLAPSFRTQAYFRNATWRGTWKGEGGGVLLNQAPHALDLFIWISGMMPERVIGLADTVRHRIEVEDRAAALLQYPNGATGYVYTSTVEAPTGTRMEFAGEKGKLVVDGGLRMGVLERPVKEYIDDSEEVWGSPACEWSDVEANALEGARQGHEGVIEDFVESVQAGRAPMVSGEEGLKSLELANAIILSNQRNEGVDVPIPRKAYSELIGLLAGRASRRRRRGTGRTRARRG